MQTVRFASSFRDPHGFLFKKDDIMYRQINETGKQDYDLLMDSGLYEKLAKKGWIVRHSEVDLAKAYDNETAYIVIKPEEIPYISYPYEWSFSQYRDAALLTLETCLDALGCGMVLKDASAYNIQFVGSKPVLIDTLSFQTYEDGTPWIAYGQFCRHFLAPILLMLNVDTTLSQLMRIYIDGIPLDLAAELLPKSKRLNISYYIHIFLQGKKIRDAQSAKNAKEITLTKKALVTILQDLKKMIKASKLKNKETEWGSYYEDMLNYSDDAFSEKAQIVKEYLDLTNSKFTCDMAGNRGEFSKIAAQKEGSYVICFDIDHTAVDRNFASLKKDKVRNILPLIVDLTNPSPDIGWANNERDSLERRSGFDCMMSLALIHHLAISNNLPFELIASFFSKLAKYLIIEFVPKEDSQVQKLLSTREDIFDNYHIDAFEASFNKYFSMVDKKPISESLRIIYLFKSRSSE